MNHTSIVFIRAPGPSLACFASYVRHAPASELRLDAGLGLASSCRGPGVALSPLVATLPLGGDSVGEVAPLNQSPVLGAWRFCLAWSWRTRSTSSSQCVPPVLPSSPVWALNQATVTVQTWGEVSS